MDDLLPAIGAGGLASMLVALFTVTMNAILKTGSRADERSDKEIDRLHAEAEQDRLRYEAELAARAEAYRTTLASKDEEIGFWREKFLETVQHHATRPTPPGGE